MERIHLRSAEGWRRFDLWAFALVIVLPILLLIMAANGLGPAAEICCRDQSGTESTAAPAVAESQGSENVTALSETTDDSWRDQEAFWPGCEAVLSASYLGFESSSHQLTQKGQNLLDHMLQCLDNTDYQIVGHTDDTGDQNTNLELSLKRAESVRVYLIANGIDSGRLTVDGMGESDPIADNSTEAGRARNRRIEFIKR